MKATRRGAEPASKELAALLTEAERYGEQGPDKPFLDVWFENDKQGYVVGGYNLIFATADGGKTWESWFDRTDNPKLLNLYSIRPAAGGLYITGEGGLVLKLDATAKRFRAVPVDYKGSLFGVADAGDAVLVFGLRGNAFRTTDGGAHWSKVDSQLAGLDHRWRKDPTGTCCSPTRADAIVASSDGGKTFKRLDLAKPMPVTSITTVGGGKLALTGPLGVVVVDARGALNQTQ